MKNIKVFTMAVGMTIMSPILFGMHSEQKGGDGVSGSNDLISELLNDIQIKESHIAALTGEIAANQKIISKLQEDNDNLRTAHARNNHQQSSQQCLNDKIKELECNLQYARTNQEGSMRDFGCAQRQLEENTDRYNKAIEQLKVQHNAELVARDRQYTENSKCASERQCDLIAQLRRQNDKLALDLKQACNENNGYKKALTESSTAHDDGLAMLEKQLKQARQTSRQYYEQNCMSRQEAAAKDERIAYLTAKLIHGGNDSTIPNIIPSIIAASHNDLTKPENSSEMTLCRILSYSNPASLRIINALNEPLDNNIKTVLGDFNNLSLVSKATHQTIGDWRLHVLAKIAKSVTTNKLMKHEALEKI